MRPTFLSPPSSFHTRTSHNYEPYFVEEAAGAAALAGKYPPPLMNPATTISSDAFHHDIRQGKVGDEGHGVGETKQERTNDGRHSGSIFGAQTLVVSYPFCGEDRDTGREEAAPRLPSTGP